MNACVTLVCLLALILYLIYVLSKKKFDYWAKKNVPHLKPLPFVGNYGKYVFLQEYVGHVVQKLCNQFPKEPYFGAYYGTEPVLIVQSPELIKNILVKDFYYFSGREITKYEHHEIITQNLFFSSGDKWKTARQTLTPLFSSAKMKNMFYLIEKCQHLLENMLDHETSNSGVVEVRNLAARFTMDCITSCAFGVEANTMTDIENNPFKIMAEQLFNSTYYSGVKVVCRAIWPAIFYGLGFKLYPETINKFFSQMLKGVFESRNYQPSSRNDFVDLMLTLKKEDIIYADSIKNMNTGLSYKIEKKVDDDFIVGQCIVFFAAGFETSATSLGFTLYELAKHPELQKRAAEEVDEYLRRHGNKVNYECVNELPYLEACFYEAMRMYPVIGNLTREVMDDVTLPDGLHLDKGVRVHIPVHHIHYNPEYYPEPERYKPERFLPENKNDLKQFTYFPYGEGSRICIGKRFAKMQVLIGLIGFLKKYRLELAEGMPEIVPLATTTFLIQPNQGLYLKFIKRDG